MRSWAGLRCPLLGVKRTALRHAHGSKRSSAGIRRDGAISVRAKSKCGCGGGGMTDPGIGASELESAS